MSSKPTYTHFYFDNSFFWCLSKDATGAKVKKINESLEEFNIIKGQQDITIIASPFTLLESIGISKIPMPQITPPANLLDKNCIEELKFFLSEQAYIFFSQQEKLKLESIIKATEEQQKFGSDFGKMLFNDVIAHNVQQEGFAEKIYQHLALDYIHKFKYPDHILESVSESFIADILRSTCIGWNASQARLISMAYNKLSLIYLSEGAITEEDHQNILDKDYCFKLTSDLMDTELTHIATVGWGEKESQYSTVCFTIDPPNKVKFRLLIYSILAQIAYDTVKNEDDKKRLPFEYVEMKTGIVCICCNKTGEILEKIEVDKILSIESLEIV
jgi:hypothetical protein